MQSLSTLVGVLTLAGSAVIVVAAQEPECTERCTLAARTCVADQRAALEAARAECQDRMEAVLLACLDDRCRTAARRAHTHCRRAARAALRAARSTCTAGHRQCRECCTAEFGCPTSTTATSTTEPPTTTTSPPSTCGDGIVTGPAETCDPPGVFCRGGCDLVTGICVDIGCRSDCTCPEAACGDWLVDPGEDCDPPGSACATGATCAGNCSCTAACGLVVCPTGTSCCDPLCGTCVPPGVACTLGCPVP